MHHLMGTAEIAELMGVSRQRVAQIANGDSGFPAPVATLKGGSVWERAAVEQWMEHNAKEQPPRRVGIFNRMDDDARRSIVRAQEESRRLGHAFIGTEHLLLGVLQSETDPVVRRLVAAELPSIEAVRDWISERIPPSEEPPGSHVPFTPRSKQVLEATVTLAGRAGAITTATLLLALASDKNGVAAQALNHFDVSVDKIEGYSEFPEPGPISQRQSGTYDERTAKRLGEVAAYLRGIAEELQQSPTPEVELIEHGAPKESEDWRSLIRCSFCSKPRAEVTKIIAGPGCYICNECVDLCNEIIAEGQEHD